MKITLEPRWVYGRTLYYPRCPLAEGIAKLGNKRRINTPTLTQDEVDLIESLGIRIKLVASKPDKEKA